MPRRRSSTSDSFPEKEVRDDSSFPAPNKGLSEYEIRRLSRIAENRKRMAALGLPQIASSLMTGPSRSSSRKSDVKGKRKLDDEDKDYEPPSDEEGDLDDDNGAAYDEEDQNYLAPRSARGKAKRPSKPKKKTPVKGVPIKSDSVDDDDELMQAIALSLRGNNEMASPGKVEDFSPKERLRTEVKGVSQKGKSKTSFSSRVKMTEDELILYFFQFDEDGKGSINVQDLAKVAIAHDFTWTDNELVDMIRIFDTDGDGKLGLDDFRKIAQRCNMIHGPE